MERQREKERATDPTRDCEGFLITVFEIFTMIRYTDPPPAREPGPQNINPRLMFCCNLQPVFAVIVLAQRRCCLLLFSQSSHGELYNTNYANM